MSKNKNYKPKKTAYEIKKDVAYFTKNRLPAFILAGLIIFWTIASIFGIIGYSRTKPKNTAMITASADSFQSALRYEYSIDVLPLFGLISYTYDDFDVFNHYLTLHIDGSGAFMTYHTETIYDGCESTLPVHGKDFLNSVTVGFDILQNEFVDDLLYEDITGEVVFEGFNSNNVPFFTVNYYFKYGDVLHSVRTELLIEFNYTDMYAPFYSTKFAENDQSVYLGSWSSQVPYGEAWLYYSEYVKGIGDYNLGYNEGYLQGLKSPNQQSYDEGYSKGKTDGYRNGYDVGFTAGATDGNDYTFTGLLSAIFDVPVKTFTALFNFDLLGVNLANFFLSMLTLAVVLTIVRMLL